jgi:hypothetical protein
VDNPAEIEREALAELEVVESTRLVGVNEIVGPPVGDSTGTKLTVSVKPFVPDMLSMEVSVAPPWTRVRLEGFAAMVKSFGACWTVRP